MDRYTRDTIATIAHQVRVLLEAQSFESGYGAADLAGWCAIGAGMLCKALIAAGYKAEIGMWEGESGECHCYCIVDDHVVDVTATQFSEFVCERVVIMREVEAMEYGYYHTTNRFKTVKDLRRYQKREGWPSDQLAFI